MAFSSKTHTGDGVTTDFNVPFSYLDQSHIAVRVDKVFTTEVGAAYTFSFTTPTTIRVTKVVGGGAPDNGAEIEFIRQTPINTPAVVFGGGASLSSENLNKNSNYLTYALQEATDANEAFTKLYLGAFSEPPTTDNDGEALQVGAVYYDTDTNALYYYTTLGTWIVGESTLAAETAQVAAEAAQAAAETAQTNAETAEIGAVVAQAAAVIAQGNAETAETGAVAAQAAALIAQAAAEAVYDDFDDRYLGAKAADPAVDNDGNTLATGALVFNTTVSRMKVYNGSAWVEVVGDVLIPGNNLSDLVDAATARTNLGLAAGATAAAASQAEAEAGAENTKFMTALRVSQAIALLATGYGDGQTWQDVKASRAGGTSYQNTTGKTIFVAISDNLGGAPRYQVSTDNVTWVDVGLNGANSEHSFGFPVPNGHYYRSDSGVAAGSWTIWAEMR